ncbi:DUF4097 family beta strand repeat-containing protein [Clostridium algidicarnis]|uniref:DUF4097 family beta strand repeat-containing protein n=1 Tax=Clostridium algidicarnis TaxID=37659 RepID=UPI001C0B449F|nr:DUF4097 family beta strand repeat-containing protein [Clostridium algidicarnis]MBU3209923.1 DUF4097 family beta strand repeat protein [Clostridium algidicarnis]MBU3228462.1 DUF4097 family beta strand repeat protein [Clostridium algidicarnis]MBU3252205.1 DUF4097 family beta strand repeat protein [Clostridium algidicarnis]
MKKVGTFTLALSLIFLGAILIIKQIDPAISMTIFKFWPGIFIILGIEYLLVNRKQKHAEVSHSFNFGIIIVIIIFIIMEGFYGFKINVIDEFKSFDKAEVKEFNIDKYSDGRKINVDQELYSSNKNIKIDGINAKITLKRSTGDSIRIVGDINVSDDYFDDSYEIKMDDKEGTIYVKLEDNQIKAMNLIIYVPSSGNLNLNFNNAEIKNEDDMSDLDLKINNNNGNFILSNFRSIGLNVNNGNINIKDTNNINIASNNIKAEILGDIEKLNIKSNISSINVKSSQIKEAHINSHNGKIKLQSGNKTKLDIESSKGKITVDDKKISGNTFKKDEGDGIIKIKIDLGVISVNQTNDGF